MSAWTEVHWSEGMFLRPHHLQTSQRWLETLIRTSLDAARPFGWGFLTLQVAPEPLENFTLRLDNCDLRLKDGTWVRVPENTEVPPLNFQKALEAAGSAGVGIVLGIPEMQEVRANSVALENPDDTQGTPRYEPFPVARRDENTGANTQTIYVRRMRGRLFTEGEDTTGYETIRVGRVKRTDRPGATPEMDELGAGPLLAIQADSGLSALVSSLADQVEAKDEILCSEARELRMAFTDGVASNTEHLLKLHVLNETRTHLRAAQQSPVLHPYDVFMLLARLAGHLSIFSEEFKPDPLPQYDHDSPGVALDKVRRRVVYLLDALRPVAYAERPFGRKADERGREGLEVELDRKWVDDNLEMFVALHSTELDQQELYNHVYGKLDMKLASPTRSPKIHNIAVRGLRLQVKSPPAGTLPRRQGLHYYKVDKTLGPDRTDYYRECEQERGVRMSIREGQIAEMEGLRPTLYIILKG